MTDNRPVSDDILPHAHSFSLSRRPSQAVVQSSTPNTVTQTSTSSSLPIPDPAHSEQYLSPAPNLPSSEQVSQNLSQGTQSGEHLAEPSRPAFQQFFTLVSDVPSQKTHHPLQVHYIFSDDDPELLTSACLDAIQVVPSPYGSSANSRETTDALHANKYKKKDFENAQPVRENRVLLLDTDPSGTQIISAHSLTPDWQILNTSLVPAPTWEGDTGPEEEGAGGMMLKIEGTDGGDVERQRSGLGISNDGQVHEDDFQSLVAVFEERMKTLRNVIDSGSLFETDVAQAEKSKIHEASESST